MRKKSLMMIAVLAGFFATNAYAGDRFSVSPYYMGIGGKCAVERYDHKTAPGAEFLIGRDMGQMLGVEMTVDYLDRFDTDNGLTLDEVDLTTVMVVGKFYPVRDSKIQGFLALGAGVMRADVSEKDTALESSTHKSDPCGKIGVGLDYDFNAHWGVEFEADYVAAAGVLNRVDYHDWNLKLMYRF